VTGVQTCALPIYLRSVVELVIVEAKRRSCHGSAALGRLLGVVRAQPGGGAYRCL
jgi:hypothetical protein